MTFESRIANETTSRDVLPKMGAPGSDFKVVVCNPESMVSYQSYIVFIVLATSVDEA